MGPELITMSTALDDEPAPSRQFYAQELFDAGWPGEIRLRTGRSIASVRCEVK